MRLGPSIVLTVVALAGAVLLGRLVAALVLRVVDLATRQRKTAVNSTAADRPAGHAVH